MNSTGNVTARESPVAGNTELTKPENRAFHPALDGLRAIAFLLVFFYHEAGIPWRWAGVNMFFVLSGFLITGILCDSRNDAFRARNFYARRALRIFPLFYTIVLIFLLLYPICHWQWSWYWLAWPLYIGNFLPYFSRSVAIDDSPLQLAAFGRLRLSAIPHLTLYISHFWSLCVEEQFYFVWPWIVFWVRSRKALLWICGTVVVAAPIARVLCDHIAPPWMVHVNLLERATPFQLDSLLLGAFIALLVRARPKLPIYTIGKITGIVAGFVAFAVLTAGIVDAYPNWNVGYAYPQWEYTWGLTLINVLAASVMIIALQPSTWVHRILCVKPLRWIGRISYGAYVFHNIFHRVFFADIAILADHVGFVAHHMILIPALFGLAATLLIAWVSFEYLESPFLNLKERWTVRPAASLATTGSRA